MSHPAIQVEGLGKRYQLHHELPGGTLRDRLSNLFKKSPASSANASVPPAAEEDFWALRDLNFTIQPGEVVGIVGRNGAGKSTLLKLLSRITEPTTGRITLHGRVASLLEVGTGFHGELSGRENVFLNGAILGMTRVEIRQKFDEIIAFAEIERFIDTPVKRYSSGMYMRLAFAVAAHLEPEILIIDEVLAVGDAAFQKKCLGKMESVSRTQGRTILFVSHNLSSVRQLCTKALHLERGQLLLTGTPTEVIAHYAQRNQELSAQTAEYRHIQGDGRARIKRIHLSTETHQTQATCAIFETLQVAIDYELAADLRAIEFFLLIYSDEGDCIASIFQRDSGQFTQPTARTGTARLRFTNPFTPGRFRVSAGIFDANRTFLDWVEFAEEFQVEPSFANGQSYDARLGRLSLQADWLPPSP